MIEEGVQNGEKLMFSGYLREHFCHNSARSSE
jgi:hypothetical protein